MNYYVFKFRVLIVMLFFAFFSNVSSGQFVASSIPDNVFPTPGTHDPIMGFPGVISPTIGSIVPPVYYGNQSRGSSCIVTGNIDPGSSDFYYYKFWGFNFGNIRGLAAGIAFEIEKTVPASGVVNKGFTCLSSDAEQVEVTWFMANGQMHVLAAYQSGMYLMLNDYYLDPNPLSPTSGLNFISRTEIDSHLPYGTQIQLMTQNNTGRVILTWESPSGIYLKAMASTTGSLIMGPNYLIPGTAGAAYPDVSINEVNTSIPYSTGAALTYPAVVHTVYVNPGTLQIIKGHIGFWDIINSGGPLLTPAPAPLPYTVENIETISNYDPSWDGFQLQLATPNGDYGFGELTWAYTYYNNVANNIYLTMSGRRALHWPPIGPAYIDPFIGPQTHVLNNGSLGNADIRNSANAFPTITYTSPYGPTVVSAVENYNKISVGWYTSFDPVLGYNPTDPGNPLYSYSSDSKRYVAVHLSDDPALASPLLTPNYMEVSTDNANNKIGGGLIMGQGELAGGWPMINFNAANMYTDGGLIFTSFACHGTTSVYGTSSTMWGPTSFPKDPPISTTALNEASFLSSKTIKLSTYGSTFKTTNNNSKAMGTLSSPNDDLRSLNINEAGLTVFPTLFSNSSKFSFGLGSNSLYEAFFTSIDGKNLYVWKGSLADINKQIVNSDFDNFSPGIYLLNVLSEKGKKQTFKLIKQ